MARYFNKITKNEAVEGFNVIDSNCVELPENHFFWQPLPPGKTIDYDADGLPVLAAIIPTDDELANIERDWRNAEIIKIVTWLNQVFNDQLFGTVTFPHPYTAEQLNAYRVALCHYPDAENFPHGVRPNIDDFA